MKIAHSATTTAHPTLLFQANFINSDTNLESSLELEALKAVVEQGALAMPSISVYGLDQVRMSSAVVGTEGPFRAVGAVGADWLVVGEAHDLKENSFVK